MTTKKKVTTHVWCMDEDNGGVSNSTWCINAHRVSGPVCPAAHYRLELGKIIGKTR